MVARTGSPLRLEHLVGIDAVRSIEADWRMLFSRTENVSPSAHYDFTVPCWELHEDGSVPRVMLVRDPDGTPLGLLPLAMERRRYGPVFLRVLRPLAQPRVHDLDFLVMPGHESGVAETILAGLQKLVGEADRAELAFMSSRSSLADGLLNRDRRWVVETNPTGAARIVLPAGIVSWEELLARRARGDIRRLRRQLESQHPGTVIGEVPVGDRFLSACRATQELHTARALERGWQPWFEIGKLQEGFPRMLEKLASQGMARLYTIEVDGRVIAGQIVLCTGRYAYSFKIAFDRAWAHYGPGAMLHSVAIQDSIDRGDRIFDLGHDRDAYKRRWSNQLEPLRRARYAAPTWRNRIADGYLRFARAAGRQPLRQPSSSSDV